MVFSSDHGPWFQGSPGGLRGRKGETFEGGVRVPFVARYPGFIPPNQVCSAFATSLDVLPTVAGLAGAALPPNPLDGVDIRALLTGEQASLTREAFLYFNDVYLQAARVGSWKLHVSRFNVPAFCPAPAEGRLNLPLPWPELYDVVADVDESHDRSNRNAGGGRRYSRPDRADAADISGRYSGRLGAHARHAGGRHTRGMPAIRAKTGRELTAGRQRLHQLV